MGISPAPRFPERAPQVYERKAGANDIRRGPLRFEEGIATDTDVPSEFQKGMMQGMISAQGRPNRNANVFEKPAAETLSERAHVGSAAWVEAPTFLGEFAHGSFTDYAEQKFEEVIRSGGRTQRMSPTVVND
ncbi:MAG: hypothetical protein EBT07_02355 [Actinobacteria bacterium]|jgi:hypothetical protein|nr:hypothetical protein [Actinomycetota bacterium]